MLKMYSTKGGELQPSDDAKLKDAIWIDAVAPTPEEVEYLHKEFELDLQDVADCLDPNERSRVELEETYDLLVMRTLLEDYGEGGHRGRVQTMPIGIFITKGKVITVRIGSSFSCHELTSDLKRKPKMESKEDLFLMLVRRVNKDIERRVRPMERTIALYQEKILTPEREEIAPHVFALSNELILVNSALLSNLNAFSMIARAKHLKLNKDKLDLFEDIENDVGQLYEMTTTYREIMSNVLDAYESALANSLSTVMKTLTTISLILFIPIMITAMFSMNLVLPLGHDNPMSFWAVVVISAVAVFAMWIVFRIKRIL